MSKHKPSRRVRRFAPRVEGLEDRSVPAGNVIAFASGGALYLYGDDQGNQVYVGPADGRDVFLASLDGTTTINGLPGPVFLGAVTERIEAHLGGGDDVLAMFDVHPHFNLTIDTGDGDDTVVLFDVSAVHSTSITTGAGNDFVRLIGGEFRRDATIDLGAGNDRLSIDGTRFRHDTAFHGGDGLDALGVNDPEFRNDPTVGGFEVVYPSLIPVAAPDAAAVAQGGTTQIPVLANDAAPGSTIDPATVVIARQPQFGTATANADGTVTYTNNGAASATDSFTYIVRNALGVVSNEAPVFLSVAVTNPGGAVSPPTTPPTVPPPPTATGPVPVVSSSAPAVTNTSPIPFTVTFDTNVSGFTQSDVAVTNGTASGFTAVDGRTYTVNVTPAGQGAVTLSVPASVAQDAAGNNNKASNALTRTFDSVAPVVTANTLTTNDNTPTLTGTVADSTATVSVAVGGQTVPATVSAGAWTATVPTALADGAYTIQVTATDPAGNAGTATKTNGLVIDTVAPSVAVTTTAPATTGGGPQPFTATFSEDVTGFDQADVQATNGTVSNFATVDARTYTFDVTPTASGTVTVTVPAGVATDAAGNANTAGSASRTADVTRPGVTLATTAGNPTNAPTIPFTATFTEDVTGFAAADVVVANGTVASFRQVDPRTYTFDAVPAADGRVTVYVPAGVAQDALGNPNTASNPVSLTSDRTAPTPAVTSSAGDPTAASPIPFTVTFDEDVTGFAAADVSVVNGTVSNFAAVDARTYTVDVTPNAQGAVTVSVAAGVARDAAGNDNVTSNNLTRTYNGPVAVPAVTTSASNPTNLAQIPFTVTFSEDVTGFDQGDLGVTNGTVSGFVPVDLRTYTFDVAPTADGTVTVSVLAGAATGPGGVPSAAGSGSVVSDRSPPTATVTATPNPTNASPIVFTVSFNEDVTGLTGAGLSATNGTVGTITPVNASTFTVEVTPAADGPVTLTVVTGGAQDVAGNATAADFSGTVTSDRKAPTATVTATADPTNADPIVFTVTFSEPVSDLGTGGLSATNGTVGTITRVDAQTFTVEVSPAADGTVTLDVLAAAVQDPAGNGNTAASGSTTSDRTPPAVAVNPLAITDITGTSSDVTAGVTAVAVSIFDGTNYWSGAAFDSPTEVFLAATTANGWADWSFAFSTIGTYTVRARATDAAGNVAFTSQTVVVGPGA